ncbi:MAG TPA: hypothetical protein IAA27_10140 [Candidatus Enterococcus stercoravium]|nr:hypothetical protein [Candidatus Enterococcus stercoravium]
MVLKSEELLGTLTKEAKERQAAFHGNRFTGKVDLGSMEPLSKKGKTSEKIAEIARTSRVQVDRLRRVKREAPEKYAEVVDGKKSIRKAYDELPPTRKRKSKRSAVQGVQETKQSPYATGYFRACFAL